MPRKSLVHYIAPSAISITPNCNESANDLAVSLIRGAKIKVFSPAVGLETEDGYFQEWTLYGRNRRLADSAGNDGHRYTIYARLPKANKDGGYLVFAQMTKDEDGEWVDKYWHVTSKGYSRRDDNRLDEDFDPDDPPQTDEDEKRMQKNNWWFRLGEVSEPSGGQRTVTLDTGILGTDQFNTEWNIVQEGLHVDLTCRLVEPYEPIPDLDPDDEEPEPEGEDAGPTPYVPWGYWLFMKAELAGVRDDEVVEVKKWEITRSTGAGSIDWMEEDDPRREQFKKKGRIDLKHTRGGEGTDDFEAAVSLVFTVTAWGTKRERTDKDDEEEEQEPVVVVQDGDEGEEGDDGEILAMATITIMSETNEQYALQLSETIVNYDEENGFSPEKVFVHVRSTDQRTAVTDITTEQMTTARLSVEYALANDLDTWIPLTFADSDPTDPDDPDYPNLVARAFIGGGGDDSVFYEGENIIVRLIETLQQKGEDGQISTAIKELSRKTILNYYNLGTKYVTVGFFKKLFAVHHIGDDGNDEIIETNRKIKDEDEDPTVNIEAKRGFWSPSYVSALGQGSGEGGGGAALEWPLQDINVADMPRNPKAGDTIVWDGTTFSWGKSGADMKKLTLYNGPTTLAEYDGKQAVQLDLAQHFVKTQGSSTITGDLLLIRTPGTAIGNTSVLTKQDAEKLFDERYVRVDWFKKLFEAREQDGTEVKPNEDGPINNLKVLVGTWTQQYLSALGIGSDGGSGGVWYLNLLEDVDHSKDPQNNDTLIWDGLQWTFGTAGLDTNELNRILQGKTLTIKDGTTSLGSWNPSQPGEIDISAILTGKKWWGRSLEGGQVKGSLDDVGNITPDNAGPYSIGSDQKRFGAIYVDEIHVGPATISWDGTNLGLHLTKAMYSDEWVSALGTGSSGGPGGLDLELMWEALGGTYQTNEQISASHLSNVTNPLRVYVDNELVCTYDGKDAKRLYLQSGGSIGDGVQLWGNPFDGTNSVNGNITFGASGSNVAGLMYFHTDTDKQVRITTLSNTAVASYTRSGQTYRPRVYVDGNVGVTGEVWMDRLTFAGSNANGGYIDFHYGGDNSDQYTTQIVESALGVLTVQRRSGATGLVVGGSANADYIQIGGAKIMWDNAKQALHIDKGVWSDSFVSALGTGSEGGPGGIDLEDMWTALGGTYLTREQISADHLANVTKTLTLKVGSTTYTYNGTANVGPIDLSAGGADISEYSWWGAGMTGKKREGNMSNVGDITFQATGKNIGGVAFFDTEHTRLGIGAAPGAYALDVSGDVKANKFYFNSNVYLECDSNGDVHLHGAGFWADDFVSTLGTGSAGGGGTPLDTLLMSLNGAANVQNPDGVSNKVLVCTNGDWSWQTYNAGGGGGTTVSANLWGNHFDGTNDIGTVSSPANLSNVGSILMNSTITGCTAIDNIAYFDTTNSRLGIGKSNPTTKLDVDGRATMTAIDLSGELDPNDSKKYSYIDFHYNGSTADFTTRLIETTSGILSVKAAGGDGVTGFIVGRGNDGDHLKIGGATLTWVEGKGLKIDTGFWSESFVSALGTGSSGGGGGIDLDDVFAAYRANNTSSLQKIHNSHLNFDISNYALDIDVVKGVKVNGMTYAPDADGIADLGTISGGTGNYLPLTGGTLTGNLGIKGGHDLSQSNNGVSSTNYIGYYIKDKNNKRSAQYINTVQSDGTNRLWMSVTYNVSGAQEQDKGFGLAVDKQGNCTWYVDGAASFRTAIGVNLDNIVQTSGDQTIDGTKTFTGNVSVGGTLTVGGNTLIHAGNVMNYSMGLQSYNATPSGAVRMNSGIDLNTIMSAGTYCSDGATTRTHQPYSGNYRLWHIVNTGADGSDATDQHSAQLLLAVDDGRMFLRGHKATGFGDWNELVMKDSSGNIGSSSSRLGTIYANAIDCNAQGKTSNFYYCSAFGYNGIYVTAGQTTLNTKYTLYVNGTGCFTNDISETVGSVDLSFSGNNIASTSWKGFRLYDKEGRRMAQFINTTYPNTSGSTTPGWNGFWISACNYDTSGTMKGDKGFGLYVDKDGKGHWVVHEAESFREAIGVSGSSNDTKDTTGIYPITQEISDKAFYLVGNTVGPSTSQDYAQTYSTFNCYFQNGELYSNGNKVLTVAGGSMDSTTKVTNLNADLLDGYEANNIFTAASLNFSHGNSANTYMLIAEIKFTGSGTDLNNKHYNAGFSALFTNRELLENNSFFVYLSIRRVKYNDVSVGFYYTPLGANEPRKLYVRSDDGVNFSVYLEAQASTWNTFYGLTKLYVDNSSGNATVTFPCTGTKTPILGTTINVQASKSIAGGDYLPLTGGTVTGDLTIGSTSSAASKILYNSNDATLKIYPIDTTYGHETVAIQTCFDQKDPETASGTYDPSGSNKGRCVLALQPRGGYVGIGTPTPGSYNLYVNGSGYFAENLTVASGKQIYIGDKVVIKTDTAKSYAMGLRSYANDGATNLPANTDLNSVRSAGTYCCQSAASLSNQPIRGNYRLWHIVNTGTDNSISQNSVQIALYTNEARMYMRNHTYSGSTEEWGDWVQIATTGNTVLTSGDQSISGTKTFTGTLKAGIISNVSSLTTTNSGILNIIGTMSTMYIKEGHIYDPNNTIAIQAGGDTGVANPRNVTICHGGGNVGIGAGASDTYKLYVNGTSYFNNEVHIDDGKYMYFQGVSTDSSKVYMYGNIRHQLQIYAANIYFNGTSITSSDIRLKDIHENLNLGVEVIARAPIFNYSWKKNPEYGWRLGSSAQYWQNVFRYAVDASDEGYLGMDYSSIALAAAVMTARTVLSHEERIAKLEAENKRLRAEINELKQAA